MMWLHGGKSKKSPAITTHVANPQKWTFGQSDKGGLGWGLKADLRAQTLGFLANRDPKVDSDSKGRDRPPRKGEG